MRSFLKEERKLTNVYTLICKQINFETDIKVFEHQKIKDTLSILYNEKIIAINPDNPIAIQIRKKGRND